MGQVILPKQLSDLGQRFIVQLRQPGSPKRLAIFEACIIGIVSGLAAFCLKEGAGQLGSWRVYYSLNSGIPPWLFLPGLGLVGGFITGLLVERFASETSGSGVPQVKAALAGLPISLDLRVAIAKLIGTMFTMGAGLTLGRQGPTVQIGAAIAAWISRWVPTSPTYRHQMIACGAAAGLAAGFNAPLAGVLFVVEDLLHDISGITLGPAIIASFIGAVVARLLGGQEIPPEQLPPDVLQASYQQWLLELPEIPFYIILGIAAGVFGTLFSRAIVKLMRFNRQTLKLSLPWRMALSGVLCGLIVSVLPVAFRNNAGLREIILSGDITWQTAACFFLAYFLLTTIAASSAAPGGLFAPSLILGAALGELIGIWEAAWINLESPTTFALAGMAAFFCAVSRTPMTSVVIVFEITKDFNLVLQLMICTVVAYLVSERLDSYSLYDRLLQLNGIELNRNQTEHDSLSTLTAGDIMQRQVETLESTLPLEQVRACFSQSHHRGFPVIEQGKLIGIVTEQDLEAVNKRFLHPQTPLHQFMVKQPITVKPNDALSEVLYLLAKYKPSRLPVVEGRKIVGIITRSDIIRTEINYITGEATQIGRHTEPSYPVYYKRSPQTGSGRLLISLHNPQTAPALLRVAVAIARERNYEIECISVIVVPRHQSCCETSVSLQRSLELFKSAEHITTTWKIPLHTQVRVAHDVSQAVLEAAKDRHIDLILIGWRGEVSNHDRVFGDVVDHIMQQATAEVVVVKWAKQNRYKIQQFEEIDQTAIPLTQEAVSNFSAKEFNFSSYLRLHWNRWLVPVRDGSKQAAALQLLPALMQLSLQPNVLLLKVIKDHHVEEEIQTLDFVAQGLSSYIEASIDVTAVCTQFVAHGVLDVAHQRQCDVIVLGASQEGMLRQVIQGNIPEAIARGCDCTVILVRPAIPR
ncbi:MAG: chloride channel protein [Microcoleaceae cyanobacterium]